MRLYYTKMLTREAIPYHTYTLREPEGCKVDEHGLVFIFLNEEKNIILLTAFDLRLGNDYLDG